MKKPFLWIAYIVLFGFIFACTGCFPHKYTLMYEQSEIKSIEIVSLPYGHHYTESLKEETLLGQIEDISAFLNDFSKMEFEYIHPPMIQTFPQLLSRSHTGLATVSGSLPMGYPCFGTIP